MIALDELQRAANDAAEAAKANPADAALHAKAIEARNAVERARTAQRTADAAAAQAERRERAGAQIAADLRDLDARAQAFAGAVPELLEQAAALYPALVDVNDRRAEVGLDPVPEERIIAPILLALVGRRPKWANELARFLTPPSVYAIRVNRDTGHVPNVLTVLGKIVDDASKDTRNDPTAAERVKARLQVHATATTRAEAEAALEDLAPPTARVHTMAAAPLPRPGVFQRLFPNSTAEALRPYDEDGGGPSAA